MNKHMKQLAITSILIVSPLLWLLNNQVSATPKQKDSQSIHSQATKPKDKWRRMSEKEEINEIRSLTNNRLGVAALNYLALEGFIGVNCNRKFYLNEPYGGFQTLMRVKCNTPRGASIAIGYNEIRIIFKRFEGNIEEFDIERISQETGSPKIKLPD